MDWFLYDRDLRHERVKEILNRKLYFFRSGVGGAGIIIALLQRNIALTVYQKNIQFALVMTMRRPQKNFRISINLFNSAETQQSH